MLTGVRRAVDTHLPGVARTYRVVRDRVRSRRVRAHDTGLGFALYGDPGLGPSRIASFEMALFERCLLASDVVIDVGANVGLFSCVARRAGKPTVAVEPHPDNLRHLYRNLRSNGCQDVEVHPIALGERPSLLDLFGSGQGASLIRGWAGIRANTSITVPVNTLDHVLAGRFPSCRLLIKIDVEGAEYLVLEGAPETLRRTPAPLWLLEHGLTENFGGVVNPHYVAVFERFEAAGYAAFTVERSARRVRLEDARRWASSGRRDFGTLDICFVHPDRAGAIGLRAE